MKTKSLYRKDLLKNTVSMAWPAVVECFFVAFAGFIDSLMVSSLGPYSVAAVGLTTQPKFVGLAMFTAISVSVSAIVARRRGENNRMAAHDTLVTALVVVAIASILMSSLFVWFAEPIIRLCGSSSQTHTEATLYFRIIMGGIIFNCIQTCINSAQRGAGKTRITMVTNLVSSGVNVLFNYILISGKFGFPALGIKGAAIATVMGTAMGCFMSIKSLFKKDGFLSIKYIFQEKIRPRLESLKKIIYFGYSIFIEQVLLRVGLMATAIMAADMGDYEMAAHQVAMHILSLSFSFGEGLQSASVALIGRSLGAKDKELAKEYGKTCQFIGGIITIVLAISFMCGAKGIMNMFFREERIIKIGMYLTWVIIPVVLFQIRQIVYMGCLRGAGDTAFTALVSVISVSVVRTTVSYMCAYIIGLGIVGVWLGIFADQFVRFLASRKRFKSGKWTEIKI